MQLRNGRLLNVFAIFQAPMLPEGDVETLRWLISMRYRIGFLLLLVLSVTALVEVTSVMALAGLFSVNLTYLAATALYGFMLRGDKAARHANLVRQLQMPEKIALCTLAIYFFGGVLTPLFVLYPLAVLESIILMNPVGVYRTGALAIVAYCILALFEAYGVVPRLSGSFGQTYSLQAATPTAYALYTLIICSILMLTTYLANRVAQLINQRNARIDSQLHDLRTLYDIANGLGNFIAEDALLQYLATTLKSLQGASICLVGIVNPVGKIEVKASEGVDPEILLKLRDVNTSMPALAAIFERGEPLVLEDVRRHPEVQKLSLSPTTQSATVFPIKAESKVLGAVSLSFEVRKPMTPEYCELMTAIASQTGLAVERARLIGNTQRMATEMSSLYDIGLHMGSTLSADEVVQRTGDSIDSLMKPESYYIALYDTETEMISFRFFTMMELGQERSKRPLSLEKPLAEGGITGYIIKTCRALAVQDWEAEAVEFKDVLSAIRTVGVQMRAFLSVPMLWQDKVIGVISAQYVNPRTFDDRDRRLLEAMAAQAAMALENAKLHQFAQNQAQYDSLTKVYNHGCFVDLVRKAVADSDSDDSQVALIMLDIDHFKQYNDTYGHVAGDNVLRMVANALKSNIRETDYVGRWGGEEFGVLLTGASITEAKKVARLIRRAVSELYPVDGQGHLIPNPTISQGISSYPVPSPTHSTLIAQADAALYHAKAHGRNQLVIFEATDSMREATVTTGHLSRVKLAVDGEEKLMGVTDPLSYQSGSLVTTDNLSAEAHFPASVTTPRLR